MPTLKDGARYEIRQVQPNDVKKDKYFHLHEWIGKVDQFLGTHFTPGEIKARQKAFLKLVQKQEDGNFFIVGAFLGVEMIGQASLGYMRPKSNSRLKHVGSWGIVVRQEYQNQGIGKELLRSIEKRAREKGLHKLSVEVAEPNEAAKALYMQKLGYVVEGRKKDAFRLDSGEYADILVLGKILD